MPEDLVLGHEPDQPAGWPGRKAGVGEVEVAGVVDGHYRATGARDVVAAMKAEPKSLQAEDDPRERDN